jgi:hypothetical protein
LSQCPFRTVFITFRCWSQRPFRTVLSPFIAGASDILEQVYSPWTVWAQLHFRRAFIPFLFLEREPSQEICLHFSVLGTRYFSGQFSLFFAVWKQCLWDSFNHSQMSSASFS